MDSIQLLERSWDFHKQAHILVLGNWVYDISNHILVLRKLPHTQALVLDNELRNVEPCRQLHILGNQTFHILYLGI